MIGSLGGSAREEGLVCREERGPRNATNVDIARHEARCTSDVTRYNHMNNKASGGMEFYFPVKDRAFH